MKTLPPALFLLLAWLAAGSVRAAVAASLRLSPKHDAFFIENDLVYRRFLLLARDGSYRQIDRDRAVATEVDYGTWQQDAEGTVLLHFTQGGLRFHALLSGPLSLALNNPRNFGALPAAAAAIHRWLAQTGDVVFTAESVDELMIAPAVLAVDPRAESFRRNDLEALVRQIDDFVWSEQHQTFRLTPTRPPGLPLLLIQHEAIFEAGDLARVELEYHVLHGQVPPFYFAQVDAATFAREAGSWQQLR